MIDDIADEMIPVHIGHDLAVEVPGLDEIVVGKGIGVAPRRPRDVKRRLARSGVRSRPAEAIGPVIGPAAAAGVHPHEAVPLVALLRGAFGGVHRDQVIVGPQPVQVGVMIGEHPGLEHLVRGYGDARHRVAGTEGRLLHLDKIVHRVAV